MKYSKSHTKEFRMSAIAISVVATCVTIVWVVYALRGKPDFRIKGPGFDIHASDRDVKTTVEESPVSVEQRPKAGQAPRRKRKKR